MKPIYEPRGAAKEYGDLAINIYKGCPHRCYYCFAPGVLSREKEVFHNNIEPREKIVEETAAQLRRENITGKLIHLCFTCDPFPYQAQNLSYTRDIILAIKQFGNNVQILTKNGIDAPAVFDLLGGEDWFGVTLDGLRDAETPCVPGEETRIAALKEAHERGIKTWVSFEPVVRPIRVLTLLHRVAPFVDKVKIGKLNYHPSDVKWGNFGRDIEAECKKLGIEYYIKDSLRAEMEKSE